MARARFPTLPKVSLVRKNHQDSHSRKPGLTEKPKLMSDLIYNFLPIEYGLTALETHRLKVSLINELNDIYDCTPILPPRFGEMPDKLQVLWENLVIESANIRATLLLEEHHQPSPLGTLRREWQRARTWL